MVTLRDKVPYFASEGYKWFQTEDGKDLIMKGWESAGLSKCFDKSTQQESLLKMLSTMTEDQKNAWNAFNKEQESLEEQTKLVTGKAWEKWQDNSVVLDSDNGSSTLDSDAPTEEDFENSLDDFGMIERLSAFLTQHMTLPTAERDMAEQLERYPKFQSAWTNTNKPPKVPGRGRGRPKGSKNRPKENTNVSEGNHGEANGVPKKRGRPKGSKNKPKITQRETEQRHPNVLQMLITEDAVSPSDDEDAVICVEKDIELTIDVDLSAPSVTTNQPTEQADEDESDVDSDDPYNDNDVRDEE